MSISKRTKEQLAYRLQEMRQEDWFYTASFSVLGRHFLSGFFLDVWKKPFEKLREEYIDDSGDKLHEVPLEEERFYTYICRKYLQLARA